MPAAGTVAGHEVFLVEADRAGGTLGLDTGRGLDPGPLSLAAVARRCLDAIADLAQQQARPAREPPTPHRSRNRWSGL
jgi:hypothetical protein